MNATIRSLKELLALGALTGLGLVLRWVTADSVGSATAEDLTSMASLAIGAVAWVAYAWLLIAVLATVLEQVPGVVGRSASVVAARITSQGARTLLRSALGVAAVTPLTIGVAHATPGDGGQQRAWTSVEPRSTVQLVGESPADWRATEKASSVRLTEQSARTANTVAEPRAAVRAKRVPEKRVPQKRVPAGRVAVPDRPTTGAPTRYTDLRTGQAVQAASRVVEPGESLWSIAAAELGPDASDTAVAARWPQWHAANRQVIGPDPDVIRPGQVLRIPAPGTGQPVPPTHQEK